MRRRKCRFCDKPAEYKVKPRPKWRLCGPHMFTLVVMLAKAENETIQSFERAFTSAGIPVDPS